MRAVSTSSSNRLDIALARFENLDGASTWPVCIIVEVHVDRLWRCAKRDIIQV